MTDIGKVQPSNGLDQKDKEEPEVDLAKTGLRLKDGNKSIFGTPQTERNFDANIPKLCFFTFVIGLGNIQAGFAISGNNQTAPVIKAKFGWTKDEATLYNTIISSSAIFGIVVGSLVGGNFITRGRRLALIVFNVFAAIAVTLTMFQNLTLICIGRFFFGFCTGVFSVAGPKMLDETVPIHLNSSFGTATNTFLSGGIMIAVVLGAILPEDKDFDGQVKDKYWRVLYGFPYLCQFFTILIFMCCFPEDSITFSISQGKDDQALSLIRKVYSPKEDPEEILKSLKGKSQKGSSNVTLGQACCERKYARSTWVAFALCFFQQQTGLDGIMIYSNTIFGEMYDKGAITITAKQGSYIVGCVNWGGAIISPIPLMYFGRKTLLFWGQICMGVSLCLVAVFQILDYSIMVIVMICCFIISFQFSQGPIAWMYAAEVAVDTALGLCVLALFLSLLEKAITMEFMVHSAMGAPGMFFILGGVTLIGAVFVAIFIKETKGLSDLKKKQLYMPEEFILEEKQAALKEAQAPGGSEVEMGDNSQANLVGEKKNDEFKSEQNGPEYNTAKADD